MGGVATVVFEPRPCRHNKRPNKKKGNSEETMPLLLATCRPDCTEKQEIVKILFVLFFRSWTFRLDMLHAIKTQHKSETVST